MKQVFLLLCSSLMLYSMEHPQNIPFCIKQTTSPKNTPELYQAIIDNNVEIVNYCLDNDPHLVNIIHEKYTCPLTGLACLSPLSLACLHKKITVIDILLKKGAKPNLGVSIQYTTKSCDLLPNQSPYAYTALHIVAISPLLSDSEAEDIAKKLINYGALSSIEAIPFFFEKSMIMVQHVYGVSPTILAFLNNKHLTASFLQKNTRKLFKKKSISISRWLYTCLKAMKKNKASTEKKSLIKNKSETINKTFLHIADLINNVLDQKNTYLQQIPTRLGSPHTKQITNTDHTVIIPNHILNAWHQIYPLQALNLDADFKARYSTFSAI